MGPVYGGCEPGRQAEGERQVVEQAAPLGEKRRWAKANWAAPAFDRWPRRKGKD